jgi:hypothetical protein
MRGIDFWVWSDTIGCYFCGGRAEFAGYEQVVVNVAWVGGQGQGKGMSFAFRLYLDGYAINDDGSHTMFARELM